MSQDHGDMDAGDVLPAQGHSVQLESPILEPVTSAAQAPLALHVTGDDAWAAIQQDCCLRRMARSHIHFATAAHHVRCNRIMLP